MKISDGRSQSKKSKSRSANSSILKDSLKAACCLHAPHLTSEMNRTIFNLRELTVIIGVIIKQKCTVYVHYTVQRNWYVDVDSKFRVALQITLD